MTCVNNIITIQQCGRASPFHQPLNAQQAKQPRGLTALAWLSSVQSLAKHIMGKDNKNKNSLVRVSPCDALLDVWMWRNWHCKWERTF